MKIIKRFLTGVAILFCVIVAIGLIGEKIDPLPPEKAAATNAVAPSSSATPVPQTPAAKPASADSASAISAPDQSDSTDGQVLTGKAVAQAYSNYVGELYAKLFTVSVFMNVQTSKIQQAVSFNDLDAYRKSAEDLEDYLKAAQSQISQTQYDMNVSDDDSGIFNTAQDAASDVIADDLEVATDIGVNAHTGMGMGSELNKDIAEAVKSGKTFRQVILAGYKHFGVKPSEVNKDTMTLQNQ